MAAGAGKGLSTAIRAFVGLGAVAALYVMGLAACKQPTGAAGLEAFAHGGLSHLKVLAPGAGMTGAFQDAAGRPVRIADLKGKVVVLNLWATWCTPCVKEMPSLAGLQTAFAGRPVVVMPVSTDSLTQKDKAQAFIEGHAPLRFYFDPNLGATQTITPRVEGFPTTFLIDRQGRFRAVVAGDSDWSSPEARGAIEALAGS